MLENRARGIVLLCMQDVRTRMSTGESASPDHVAIPFGISSAEAKARMLEGASNRGGIRQRIPLPRIMAEHIFSVFNVLVAGIVVVLGWFYLRTGDERLLLDCVGIVTVALFNTGIAVVQEIRARRALERVHMLAPATATVIRDGIRRTIPSDDIVRGDTVVIEHGDQLHADGVILKTTGLEIDEALLTGESVPVRKRSGDPVHSGSFCVSGSGMMTVHHVGENRHAARVVNTARKFQLRASPLQRRIDILVSAMFVSALLLVAVQLLVGMHAELSDVGALRSMATLVLALIPQGLVFFFSVTQAMAMYRMSRRGAVIRKLNTVEALSNVSTVCLDKTGTLTEDRFSVARIVPCEDHCQDADIRQLFTAYAHATSDSNATIAALRELGGNTDATICTEVLPFSSARKYGAVMVRCDGAFRTLLLGAPEVLMRMMSTDARKRVAALMQSEELGPYRQLLLVESAAAIDDITGESSSCRVRPIGLAALADTMRSDASAGIDVFLRRGVRVKILTGDSERATTAALRALRLEERLRTGVSGDDLDTMPDDRLRPLLLERDVFTRLRPEHKQRIVRLLRQSRERTAMIGDGVNDVPALKEADVSVAMEGGSGVARGAADMVLLGNRLDVLADAIEQGRQVMGTTLSIARLYLTKNAVVLMLGILASAGMLSFFLTPRREAMISALAVAIPSYVISTLGGSPASLDGFFRRLTVFSGTAAACVLLFTIAGGMLPMHSPLDIHAGAVQTTLITGALLLVSWIVARGSASRIRLHGWIITGILGTYILLTLLPADIPLFRWIILFYEIDSISPELWGGILLLFGMIWVILLLVRQLRARALRIGTHR